MQKLEDSPETKHHDNDDANLNFLSPAHRDKNGRQNGEVSSCDRGGV
jgi:hypothetical protein